MRLVHTYAIDDEALPRQTCTSPESEFGCS